MKFVDVGGARLSAIGVGTWQFGSTEWGYGGGYARDEAGAIVLRALELGVNVIDTAEVYGFGRSERIVAIPGASSVRQLEDNVAAADIELDDDDDARLTAVAQSVSLHG